MLLPEPSELASRERGFDANAPLNVLEDAPVAMEPKLDAKAGAHFMQVVPAL